MRLGTAMNSGKKGVRKMREKSQVDDIDRSIYDIRDEEKDAYRMEEGLTPEIVDKLSKEKDDPVWMQQFRLQSLQIYNEMPVPNWEPSIDGLDIDHIATYVRPNTRMQGSWKDVPQDIMDDILNILLEEKQIVKINDEMYTLTSYMETAKEKIKEHLKEDPLITIAQVRDMFETSRKSAKPILEYMDSIKVTKKTGAESERVAY